MTKTKTLSGVQIKDADQGTVSAVFSTFNVVDKDGDVTLPGAIKDGMQVVISAYGHQSHWGALPVGKGTIRTTNDEAILDGQFFLNTAAGRDTFEVVKELGEIQEWSYSLHEVKSKAGEIDGQAVNYLEEIGLIKEVSPVLLGAGVGTRTLSAKGTDALRDQIAMAMDVVKATTDSAERVVALRAEQGKRLSNVNSEGLVGLTECVDRLKSLIDTTSSEESPTDDEAPEDIRQIASQVLRRDLFSNLNQGDAS